MDKWFGVPLSICKNLGYFNILIFNLLHVIMIITFIGDDMERSEAVKQWLPTYTTGRPCKNGHNTYRYTQSGTCSQCVNNTVIRPEDQSFCVLKVRVWKRDVEQVNAAMHFAMMLRMPNITMNEVTHRGKYTGIIGTSAILHYLVHT